MQKVADLHLHTDLSDGTFSPEKVVEYAKLQGLHAIAITDHDSCAGIKNALEKGEEIGIEVIPGVELTAELDDEEIHILGYFIDWKEHAFIKKLAEMSRAREERAREILKKLKKEGIELEAEELFDLFKCRACAGRLHIARLMVKKGAVYSVQEAFRKYIGNKGPCYVKKFKLLPKEAIDIIKKVGGVTVLAHPKTINIQYRTIEDIIDMLVSNGIQGLEVFHSDHTKREAGDFKKLAERFGLLITGGSDCHGLAKKEVLIGRVKVPYELVEKLRAAASPHA